MILISLLIMQIVQAQGDSTDYERCPFQFTFLFPPLLYLSSKQCMIPGEAGAFLWSETSKEIFLVIWTYGEGMFPDPHLVPF